MKYIKKFETKLNSKSFGIDYNLIDKIIDVSTNYMDNGGFISIKCYTSGSKMIFSEIIELYNYWYSTAKLVFVIRPTRYPLYKKYLVNEDDKESIRNIEKNGIYYQIFIMNPEIDNEYGVISKQFINIVNKIENILIDQKGKLSILGKLDHFFNRITNINDLNTESISIVVHKDTI